jgi:hypothetical protein
MGLAVITQNVYRILVRKSLAKGQHGRPRSRCEDNIKMDFNKVAYENGTCMELGQDCVQ